MAVGDYAILTSYLDLSLPVFFLVNRLAHVHYGFTHLRDNLSNLVQIRVGVR